MSKKYTVQDINRVAGSLLMRQTEEQLSSLLLDLCQDLGLRQLSVTLESRTDHDGKIVDVQVHLRTAL